jgi:chemotaxis family two-component system sensor kinase Cph1
LLPVQQAGDANPVDLSHAALRSVSPVHLQYLRNMGVAASMSMSIVVDDQLWGLILCHGSARHPVPSAVRTACEQIAQFVSMQVESRWMTARLAADLRAQHLRTVLIDQLQAPAPAAGLLGTADTPSVPGSPGVELRDIVTCGSAVGRLEGQTAVSGDLLDAATADRLAGLLRASASSTSVPAGSVVSSSVHLDLPDAARLLQDAGAGDVAGVLFLPVTDGAEDNYLLWIRRAVEQTVNWAGEPAVKHQSGSLSPRASFELWREKVRDHAQPWEQADVDAAVQLAEAVAARLRRLDEMALVATAVRNEQLFQREHEIADALQRGMLPVLPELPDLTLSASYLSASESAEVGGDWYDVFPLPDGAIGIAMGDVTGHDLAAAAAMGQLRSVLRSYAWEESSPEQVLDKVDALVDGFSMRHLATVFFGRLERDDAGDVLLRYANAGHLPPVLRRPDGTVSLLEDGLSVLIGVGVDIRHEGATCPVPAGSTLLLYTDGLVEQRDRGVYEGIEQLREVVAGAPSDVDELRDHVLATMVPGRREDDIAVLVVHVH